MVRICDSTSGYGEELEAVTHPQRLILPTQYAFRQAVEGTEDSVSWIRPSDSMIYFSFPEIIWILYWWCLFHYLPFPGNLKIPLLQYIFTLQILKLAEQLFPIQGKFSTSIFHKRDIQLASLLFIDLNVISRMIDC